jgi:peptidoglycan/LPS O-acetylase OafA/YrhL
MVLVTHATARIPRKSHYYHHYKGGIFMKRKSTLLTLWLSLAFCLMIPIIALAEEAGGVPTAFFDWGTLGTLSGATAAVVFIVQLLKAPLDRLWHIPTQIVVYVISVAILLAAQAFVPALGGLTWMSGILCLFNGLLVALAAMSAYEVAINKPELKKQGVITQTASEVQFDLTDAEIDKIAASLAAKMKAETAATGG